MTNQLDVPDDYDDLSAKFVQLQKKYSTLEAQEKAAITLLETQWSKVVFPLRPNASVIFTGIPADLTEAEALKLQMFIQLLLPAARTLGERDGSEENT